MPTRLRSFILIFTSIFSAAAVYAADLSPAEIDRRTDAILAKIPLERRVEFLSGIRNFSTRSVADAGLPEYLMADGPLGIRAERREYAGSGRDRPNPDDRHTTAFPASILLAASWDPSLAREQGIALAREARDYGVHVLLGPGVNIYRLPVGGRNFEYLGEDPFLAGRLAVSYIQGIQSQGVAACVKHFACNNQEHNRFGYNAIVDERALHEIYFPAFEAAIREGHCRTIMASYNVLNGVHAVSSRALLIDVLRNQWHFDGLCMSDWDAIQDTLSTINDGVDLEMPGPKFLSPQKLQPLIADGKVSQQTIDKKLRRLIRLGVEMGWNDRPQYQPMSAADYDANDQTALHVARAGITLLKNDNHVLPLDRSKIKTLAVVGPGAADYISGEGSSRVRALRPRTLMDGLRQTAGPGVTIQPIPTSSTDLDKLAAESKYKSVGNDPPLSAEFFDNKDLNGPPVAARRDATIAFQWHREKPLPQITGERFSARWVGKIKAPIDGTYIFAVKSDDGSRVYLDNDLILDNWRDQRAHIERERVELKAGEVHDLRVEYYNNAADAQMTFGWGPAANAIDDEQLATIRQADAVLCCVHTLDAEGDDRPYNLPLDQQELIKEVSAANAKTVVVLNSGGNVGMSRWIDRVPALLDGYFSGQAGGIATAEILFGDINPSGHLPATFEKSWDDAFARRGYPGDADGNVPYGEGIYVGYRYYDSKKVEPRFPFGFGLSYSTFKIDSLQVAPRDANTFDVSAKVTNTGSRTGATVAQLYVRPPAGSDRPMQELKAFARVELQPGESKSVTMPLDARSFATWDTQRHDWVVPAGEYELAVGQSSRSIDVATHVTIR